MPKSSYSSLGARVFLALLALSIGVFFAAIGVAILRMPGSGEPAWSVWFLRGFVLFVFGSMAGGGVVSAYLILRDDAGVRAVPAAVRARCPACGEPWGEGDCAACGEPREGALWQEAPRDGLGATLFGAGMGAGIACLGLFIGSGTLFGGDEKRVLILAAYAALSLLLLVVGGAMAIGCALAVRDALLGKKPRELTYLRAETGRTVSASARLERGALTMRGSAARYAPLSEVAVPEEAAGPLHPGARNVATVVAVLHARGEASLTWVERKSWSLAPGADAATREVAVDVIVDTPTPRGEHLVDARDVVLSGMADATVKELAGAVAASPDLAAAFETYAARVAGAETDPRTLDALVAVLRAPARVASPYRDA
jgi:hypothetical protein